MQEQLKGGGMFDYVKYDDISIEDQEKAKRHCEVLKSLIHLQGPGRATALAMTKLEECYMWIGKAIRDNQVMRNGGAELQESRG